MMTAIGDTIAGVSNLVEYVKIEEVVEMVIVTISTKVLKELGYEGQIPKWVEVYYHGTNTRPNVVGDCLWNADTGTILNIQYRTIFRLVFTEPDGIWFNIDEEGLRKWLPNPLNASWKKSIVKIV